jgi:hypothetical protein
LSKAFGPGTKSNSGQSNFQKFLAQSSISQIHKCHPGHPVRYKMSLVHSLHSLLCIIDSLETLPWNTVELTDVNVVDSTEDIGSVVAPFAPSAASVSLDVVPLLVHKRTPIEVRVYGLHACVCVLRRGR